MNCPARFVRQRRQIIRRALCFWLRMVWPTMGDTGHLAIKAISIASCSMHLGGAIRCFGMIDWGQEGVRSKPFSIIFLGRKRPNLLPLGEKLEEIGFCSQILTNTDSRVLLHRRPSKPNCLRRLSKVSATDATQTRSKHLRLCLLATHLAHISPTESLPQSQILLKVSVTTSHEYAPINRMSS